MYYRQGRPAAASIRTNVPLRHRSARKSWDVPTLVSPTLALPPALWWAPRGSSGAGWVPLPGVREWRVPHRAPPGAGRGRRLDDHCLGQYFHWTEKYRSLAAYNG